MWYTYKKYIDENEEVRCWFKVSANRKKVWNIQLGLIEEVKKICKKHGLKYYADSGTLLWAVRHKWFIPRDDDTDIVMFREDYDKFMKIAPKELAKHLVLQSNFCGWFAKLRNENTVALVDFDENRDYMESISLDLFPLDYMSKYLIINIIQRYTLILTRGILVSLKSKKEVKDANIFKKTLWHIFWFLFKFSNYDNIYNMYDNLCKKILFPDKSRVVARCESFNLCYNVKDFDKVKETPFESINIYIPIWYKNILRRLYWDYSKPVIWEWWHNCFYSVENSYNEIVKNWKIDDSLLFTL